MSVEIVPIVLKNKLKTIKLDHNSYLSLHVQLHNQLRQLIISGRWQDGDRIPTETQLAKHLDISRTTVRIALQRIELAGLIQRTAGRGTFVTYDASDNTSTRLIGYVTHSFHDEIHNMLLSSVETELRSAGYHLIFSKANDNTEEIEILQQWMEDNIAGLLLWPNARPSDAQKDLLTQFQHMRIPFVYIDRLVDGVEADYVASDNYAGTYALVNHLISLGHERIVYLMPDVPNLLSINERYRGYQSALHEHQLACYSAWTIRSTDENEIRETDVYRLLSGNGTDLSEQIIALMTSASPKPTAIVCANDILAVITSKALRNMGYIVPDDVSVAGFDDISLAAHMDIPLTTVTQNAYDIGRVAANLLLARLEGNAEPPKRHYVATRLQLRKSTSPPATETE